MTVTTATTASAVWHRYSEPGEAKEGPKVLFKVLSDATKAANLICGPEVTEDGE
jgi:hypothetical protein